MKKSRPASRYGKIETGNWRLVESCSCLARTGSVGGKMEIPKGNPNPLEIPEGGLEDKLDDGIGENPYHDTGPV